MSARKNGAARSAVRSSKQAALFGSLERLYINRNFSNTFPARPSLNFAVASEESAWNTPWRIDHQLSNKHTWAFRWLRESAPQFNRLDGGQETSRATATRPTSIRPWSARSSRFCRIPRSTRSDIRPRRHRPRQPGVARAEARVRPLRALSRRRRCDIVESGPILDYETFDVQSNGTMDYSIHGAFDRRHVLVVHPRSERASRPEVRRALLAHLAEQPGVGQPAGHVSIPEHRRHRIQPVEPAIISGAFTSACPARSTTK